jgi:hypothetical protein
MKVEVKKKDFSQELKNYAAAKVNFHQAFKAAMRIVYLYAGRPNPFQPRLFSVVFGARESSSHS